MQLSDCSCAPILQFFDATLDGATAHRQIQNRIFGQFLGSTPERWRNSYDNVAGWLAGWLCGWLAGWLAGCPSHSGIVSKRLNLSENFLTIWKPHHSSFLRPLRRYKIPRGTPLAGALNTRGVWKLAIFVRFSTYIAVYLGNGAR